MTLRFIFALCLFFKFEYGFSINVTTTVAPPPPDYAPIFLASQENTNLISNIIRILQETINGQLNTIIDILNAIISATSGTGKRSISQNRLGINRRIISDKLDVIGSTFTDTNNKASSVQGSLGNMNEAVNDIQSMSNSINEKTDDIKGSTEDIGSRMTTTGTTSNHIIDRVRSIKDNTNLIKTRTDSAVATISDPDGKLDVIQRLTDSLNVLANLLAQRISLLTQR